MATATTTTKGETTSSSSARSNDTADTVHSPPSSSTSRLADWVDTFFTSSSTLLPQSWRSSPRMGTIQCPCGSIQYDIYAPPSSFAIVEQTTAICHCCDCVGFARACPNGSYVLTDNHGAHMVNFYKSDLTLVKGHDKVRSVQLYDGSPLVRAYCGVCGTPLGGDFTLGPICLVYERLIHNTYPIIFQPMIILGFRDAIVGMTKPYVRSMVVRDRNYGFFFLINVIRRILMGIIFGKGNKGGMFGHNDNINCRGYDNVPIGLDKITLDDGTKPKDE